MPTFQDSVQCCNEFSTKYEKETNQKYNKSDSKIYSKLVQYGNEERAIELAERKRAEQEKNCCMLPSQMISCTTLHELIKEIKNKIDKKLIT